MTTLQTKYRDIAMEELLTLHPLTHFYPGSPGIWEDKMRGKPITIELPPLPENQMTPQEKSCGERWFRIVNGGQPGCHVCPHLAEIGD